MLQTYIRVHRLNTNSCEELLTRVCCNTWLKIAGINRFFSGFTLWAPAKALVHICVAFTCPSIFVLWLLIYETGYAVLQVYANLFFLRERVGETLSEHIQVSNLTKML